MLTAPSLSNLSSAHLSSSIAFNPPFQNPLTIPATSSPITSIAFIDRNLSDTQTLIAGLQPGTAVYEAVALSTPEARSRLL
ncbi:hypothetical protein [Alkalinema sp. FACHB-956]|uniref:hypothetical protein n=1 Tax=Alkalinema sp. FACHB-956 TaxID=2692768 RepID=UPI001688B3E3|nr:hypothetical protein [Alkalinema sp. FACHB-956]MBD2325309.1 hypothetical protein [Alkalinema sp. FACHB-956]